MATEIAEAVITTAVVKREPVDRVEVFTVKNGRACCFSRFVGADYPTTVSHLWFLDDELMSRIELPVNAPDWRTWSQNTFREGSSGQWRVEILAAGGELLETVSFQLH